MQRVESGIVQMGNWFELGNGTMNADVNSFKPLPGGYKYADKNGVHHDGKLEEKKSEARNKL